MLEPSWGKGLPLPYPSPLGGPIRHVAKYIKKLLRFGIKKKTTFYPNGKGGPRAAHFHPDAGKHINATNRFPELRNHVEYDKIAILITCKPRCSCALFTRKSAPPACSARLGIQVWLMDASGCLPASRPVFASSFPSPPLGS